MLKMIKGAKVPNPELLNEGYEIKEYDTFKSALINVNADKIKKIFTDFITNTNEELFFILEVPCNKAEEPLDENGNIFALHSNIYYLDNIYQDKALDILNKYEELIDDGMVSFGFATHKPTNELMKYKYNILSIMSSNIVKYEDILIHNNIPKVDELITAWDTFSKEDNKFGESTSTSNITKILEELKKEGLYFYKQTETR